MVSRRRRKRTWRTRFVDVFDLVQEQDRLLITAQQVAAIGGKLEAAKGQVKELESDLKEFRGINQKYTDQLIKVKVSTPWTYTQCTH